MIIITTKIKKYSVIFCAVFVFLLFFTNVKNVQNDTFSALIFCGKKIIPALLPFMIISSFFLYLSGVLEIKGKLISKVLNILGICKKYVLHIVIGSLCGFVTGAKMICENFDENSDSSNRFSQAITLSSNAGLGFVVGCVGMQLWGSFHFGIFLFFSQIIVALILNRIFFSIEKDDTTCSCNRKNAGYFSAFTKSVTTSALSIISICAFVIFFSVLIGSIASFFEISENSPLFSLLFVLFEFCQGSFYALSFSNPLICAFLSGFSVGFGGICAHFQIFSACEGFPLKKLCFFIFKLSQGIICGILSLIYALITKIKPINATFQVDNSFLLSLVLIAFVLFFTIILLKKALNRKNF